MRASLPENEPARLGALRSAEIINTPPEEVFDDIVKLAAQLCQAPVSFISFVEETRQWFKSRIGLEQSETPRDTAFCAHTIVQHDTMIVPDARADERFRNNTLVTGKPYLRFYAGTPLRDREGFALGTLCVMDTKVRELSPEQKNALEILARQVIQLLESRKALQRAHDYEFYVERANDIIFECNAAGVFSYVNPVTRKVLGYNRQDLIGMHFSDLVRADYKDKVASFYNNQFKNRIADSYYEFPVLSRTGSVVWMGQFVHMEIAENRILRIQGATRDITQIRELEEQLSASERRYRVLVECMGEGIVQTDKDDVIQFANRQFCDMVGYKLHDLEGKIAKELFLEAGDHTFMDAQNAKRMTGRTSSYDISMRRRNGDKVWVHVNASPMYGDSNEVLGTIGVVSDVSDLKLAEAALQEAEQKFRNIFEEAIMGIFQSTTDGRFLNVNRAMASIYGYRTPREMIMGVSDMALELFVDSQDRVRMKEILEASGKVEGFETRVRRKDGRIIWISETIRTVKDETGRTLYYEGMTQDITATKELGEERERLIGELREALSQVKKLSGMLPICASCKKIRDDKGYWRQIESYIREHSEADFSHGICQDCARRLYPELFDEDSTAHS